ncbi:MAG: DNA methyltransferase [Terricaulis sp.]
MRLSWNEIRSRAASFAKDWESASRERSEAQSFFNAFFDVFGVTRRRVAYFEHAVKKYGGGAGSIDLFWPGKFLVEQKSAGKDLAKAREQAMDYFPGIAERDLPRYVLLCDFQFFELIDLETREEARFALADLPRHVEKFGFILGVEKRTFREQDPVNILAAELMGKLHDALEASGYRGHELERLLVRLLFCLFADDTGIFDRGLMEDFILNRTSEDGADTGQWLHSLFEVLNTPEDRRQTTTDEDLARFPYVNGDLFAERLPPAHFNAKMRALLLEACAFNWDAISPAIFGSLFQFVMNKEERRKEGAHYTNERCILKVIEPLFLDDLRAELAHTKGLKRDREARLKAFHDKLAALTFFDPACGCGNFLVIAYRELREIELEILKELYTGKQLVLDVGALSKLSVEQFYGIELGEFPARIAEVALWMMDHIANVRLSLEFGQNYARIPLKQSPHIKHGDALELHWESVLPAARCSYIMGNPPFVGAKMQSEKQRAQVRRVADLGGSGGTLDYVAAWFIKAGAYVSNNTHSRMAAPAASPGPMNTNAGDLGPRTSPAANPGMGGSARIAFVATNSITQGEQVAQLWPILFDRCGLEIAFAHRTFAWESEARGKAHVHVVVLGLARAEDEPKEKRLFSYDDIKADPVESRHTALSPYLFDASGLADRHVVVAETATPLVEAPQLLTGVQMIDDGHYTFTPEEKADFLSKEPGAASLFVRYIGGDEYINNVERFILYLTDAAPETLRQFPIVSERVKRVRDYRASSQRDSTRKMSNYPTKLGVDRKLSPPYLVVPNVSSETREYVPIGWLTEQAVANQKLRILPHADLYHFAILTSRMHMAWMRAITGRMKSDYMYSVGVVYNNFPWPEADDKGKDKIRALAQAVLDARAAHPGATLADLYDADLMPPDLRRAHRELDAAVDKLYRREAFTSDRARVEHLFALYEKLAAPLLAAARAKMKRK